MDFFQIMSSVYYDQHKPKPKALVSVEVAKRERIIKQANERRSKRQETFITNRFMENEDQDTCSTHPAPIPIEVQKTDPRKKQMLIWKEERKRRKMLEPKKPPPFKVGIVKHDIVPFHEQVFKNPLITIQRAVRATTRAATKASVAAAVEPSKVKAKSLLKSFAPANAKFHPPVFSTTSIKNKIKVTSVKPKETTKIFSSLAIAAKSIKEAVQAKSTRSKNVAHSNKKTEPIPSKKVAPEKSKKKTPMKSLSSDLSSEVDVLHTSIEKSDCTPVQSCSDSSPDKMITNDCVTVMSPFVTVARGKSNSRRETICKQKLGYSTEFSPEKSGQHFRIQLDAEIIRLNVQCETWRNYEVENSSELNEDSKDLINLAIGQTQLLIKKKFEQFRGLISQCERKEIREGEGQVTVLDLQGFWDMVYMQVVNVDIRFNRLDELKSKNWEDDVASPIVTKTKKVAVVKPVAKNSKPTNGLKAMILAARMKSKQRVQPNEELLTADPNSEITFNGGFFSIVSPSKTGEKLPSGDTPLKRLSLLKSVVHSEAKKRLSSKSTPVAVMRATRKAKAYEENANAANNEILNDALNKTPAKGILKTPGTNKKPIIQVNGRKSNKVLFMDESNGESEDENLAQCNRLSTPKNPVVLSEIDMNTINPNKTPNQDKLSHKKTNSNKRRRLRRGNAIDCENYSPTFETVEDNPRVTRSRSRKSSVSAEVTSNSGIEINCPTAEHKSLRRSRRSMTQLNN